MSHQVEYIVKNIKNKNLVTVKGYCSKCYSEAPFWGINYFAGYKKRMSIIDQGKRAIGLLLESRCRCK